ncbi:MAG: tetratricopeptide repeat protein [Phycisphaerales bacterium]|nr:tetratricopeptide repeat protein [Phycisphaerales bacterium]MCB9855952.1 tetratricopeptide repeat protein [Phycisphaerales bacterium]MCB9864067.1 tetratricopeptide repeat protein [Phycisphaerales bacterium]
MKTTTPLRPASGYVPAVGPRLRILLAFIFGGVALIGVNSAYLAGMTFLEWKTGLTYQDLFYQYMFLAHLALGLLLVVPVIVFGLMHMRRAKDRPNRRAVRAGYALFAVCVIVLGSGLVLTRGIVPLKDATARSLFYWTHVIAPLVVVWLFILHRLAGRNIKWRVGAGWAVVAGAFAIGMVALRSQDPRQWNVAGPRDGDQYFRPALSRTATGNFIPASVLNNDQYCVDCHADVHETWKHSMHKFSSFNNPAYLFSVKNTRKAMFERDGNVRGSRFCATCHDPVPFFGGEFDKPHFDDPNYDLAHDPSAQAGITCTVCHAITNINSPRGNGDYTIEEPLHYPFAFSDNPALKWINHQLVKAKPAFHKKTFLKPLHKSAEFCGACHKVHLPKELNAYKFLRGQNHYDAYLLSGVSGHGITSFYYPPTATHNCNQCHMRTLVSEDFGAKPIDESGELMVHSHQFPSANTAIPHLLKMPEWVNEKQVEFNKGVMRVDIFGVKAGGLIDGKLTAPLKPAVPELTPGETYLVEAVIRTLKMGHLFTQGTVDSNEVWLDVKVTDGNDRVIGRVGGMRESDGDVDPWSHFVNAFVIDRDGNRIDRRNAEDIFIPLYNHQIPPGAADVVHCRLVVPSDVVGPITFEASLRYRKFDTLYMKFFQGEKFVRNDLPIMTLAEDRVVFPIAGQSLDDPQSPGEFPLWQRWNDYGIALLLKGDAGSNKGELRQAEAAFAQVEALDRADGPLNLARVYIKEGRLEEAVDALKRAAAHDPPAPPWSINWFSGVVNKQYGNLDDAIRDYRSVLAMKDTEECRKRGFDFTEDYRVLNETGQTLFERSKQERGEAHAAARRALLDEAKALFDLALHYDPENVTAHYNLALIYAELGDTTKAAEHRALHATYKPDDNARDRAIAAARMKYPAANHAAEAVAIYDLHREGAYGLEPAATTNAVAAAPSVDPSARDASMSEGKINEADSDERKAAGR